jgi:hypothetical protein
MRITLTGRRLALAAVLVLGGVAAPLAYATITAPAAVGTRAAAPIIVASPTSRQAPAAVADNPIQLVLTNSTTGSSPCHTFGFLPEGTVWVLDAVTVLTTTGTMSSATVAPSIKTGAGTFVADVNGLAIPLDGDGDGSQRFSLLLRMNTLANAAVLDAYNLNVCVTNASPGMTLTYALIVTGQRAAGSPTPAALTDFTARSGKAGTTLHWTTASETEILGFNVWRYRGAKGVKVNRALIRAKRSGEPAGASYRFVDTVRSSKRGLSYRLQLVDLKGKRTWYAAFAIASK